MSKARRKRRMIALLRADRREPTWDAPSRALRRRVHRDMPLARSLFRWL